MKEQEKRYSPTAETGTASQTNELLKKSPGRLIILTGPSAAGKDAIRERLHELYPGLQKVVTATTRSKRDNEVDGVHYHFIPSRGEFERMRDLGELLEYNEFAENYYGTPVSSLAPLLEGTDLVLNLDISAASSIMDILRKNFNDEQFRIFSERTLVFFIGVPRLTALKDRFKKRGDPKESARARIRQDWDTWKKYEETLKTQSYTHFVMNETEEMEECVRRIQATVDLLY